MPSTKYPCYIQFSDSGKTARLVHKNGMTLAELVIHGPFATRTNEIHTRVCRCGHASAACTCKRYEEAEHAPFRGEVYGLAEWELLDLKEEKVYELDPNELVMRVKK